MLLSPSVTLGTSGEIALSAHLYSSCLHNVHEVGARAHACEGVSVGWWWWWGGKGGNLLLSPSENLGTRKHRLEGLLPIASKQTIQFNERHFVWHRNEQSSPPLLDHPAPKGATRKQHQPGRKQPGPPAHLLGFVSPPQAANSIFNHLSVGSKYGPASASSLHGLSCTECHALV